MTSTHTHPHTHTHTDTHAKSRERQRLSVLRSKWTSWLVSRALCGSSYSHHSVQTPSTDLSVSRPVNKPDWSDRVKRCHEVHPRSERSTTLRDMRVDLVPTQKLTTIAWVQNRLTCDSFFVNPHRVSRPRALPMHRRAHSSCRECGTCVERCLWMIAVRHHVKRLLVKEVS